MEIALASYGPLSQTTGGYRYNRELVTALRERGAHVDVVDLDSSAAASSHELRAKLDRSVDVLLEDGLCLPSLWLHNHQLESPDAVVGLMHHLRSEDPTDTASDRADWLERRFLGSVDGIVSTSRALDERIGELLPASRPRLVAHPAGRAEGAAATVSEVHERAKERPLRICFLGSITPRKDPATLLRALANLSVPFECAFVGKRDESYVETLESIASSAGITDSVRFCGTVPAQRVRATLAESHVCCVPSRYEVFGMAYLEAMEYGVVPIATTNGGPGEFIIDGENGFLVTPGDHRKITAHLETLADRERLAEIGVAALAAADNHPGWAETAERIETFCQQLV